MRELKFRAWGRFGSETKNHMIENWQDSDYVEYVGFDGGGSFKIMQYTGLKDKNGKGIYHEDILLVNNKNYDPEDDLYYEGRVLVEKIEQLGFNLKPLDPVDEWGFDSTSMWHVGEGDTTEVIGNKFENPELSKEIK